MMLPRYPYHYPYGFTPPAITESSSSSLSRANEEKVFFPVFLRRGIFSNFRYSWRILNLIPV